ncbi:hypothetical protein AG0111_0g12084 [Alternaria gaisen]|uniref:Uncharacterized protein n=1 Tax=Alternaria gaisen TaxID=167740 RepID=A0ACB6F5Q5_9PLEO|nr:hypothetical protein AG0111_0g12084 [Alternaria gaisen]
MAKKRVEVKQTANRKTRNVTKNANQRRATQGVAKPTRLRGRSTRLDGGRGAVDKLKDARGRAHELRIREEAEILGKEHTQAAFRAKKTNEQENYIIASNKANIATVNEPGAHTFLAINNLNSSQDMGEAAKSVRKSEHIDAALDPLPAGSNPATMNPASKHSESDRPNLPTPSESSSEVSFHTCTTEQGVRLSPATDPNAIYRLEDEVVGLRNKVLDLELESFTLKKALVSIPLNVILGHCNLCGSELTYPRLLNKCGSPICDECSGFAKFAQDVAPLTSCTFLIQSVGIQCVGIV